MDAELSLKETLQMLVKTEDMLDVVNTLQDILREENEMLSLELWDDGDQLNYLS